MTAGASDRRPRLAGRRRLAAPALVLAVGAALAGCQPTSTPDAAPAAAVVQAPATATSAVTSTAPSSTPPAAPSTTASTTTPAPAPSPVVTITCPPGGAVRAATFGHTLAAAAPYTVAITYGDGRSYSGDDRHLGAVFAHTYAAPGSFDVTATVTDAAGRSAAATCTWTRTAPVAAAAPAPGAAIDTREPGSDYYTNVDGNAVHRPEAAPSAPDGATARCADGTYSSSQHHSGTCSSHGGVTSWL